MISPGTQVFIGKVFSFSEELLTTCGLPLRLDRTLDFLLDFDSSTTVFTSGQKRHQRKIATTFVRIKVRVISYKNVSQISVS